MRGQPGAFHYNRGLKLGYMSATQRSFRPLDLFALAYYMSFYVEVSRCVYIFHDYYTPRISIILNSRRIIGYIQEHTKSLNMSSLLYLNVKLK